MFKDKTFLDKFFYLKQRLADACAKAGRDPSGVRILPVTKTRPPEVVRIAYQAGLRAVGENRVQEAAAKVDQLPADLSWELIGHLQSNKVKQAVAIFDRIQSIDNLKLVGKVGEAAGRIGKPMRILLQVNSGADERKFGFEPSKVEEALTVAKGYSSLRVEGLMTIAPFDQTEASARTAFSRLRELRDSLEKRLGEPLPVLSMGMTGDLEWAVAEGSTEIRVGSALFGERG